MTCGRSARRAIGLILLAAMLFASGLAHAQLSDGAPQAAFPTLAQAREKAQELANRLVARMADLQLSIVQPPEAEVR